MPRWRLFSPRDERTGEVLTATWDVAGLRAALAPAEQAARAMWDDFRRSTRPEDIPV